MPEVYRFTVKGNQDNPLGNPVGYVRTTQRSKWVSVQYRRYSQYKDHVIAAFLSVYSQPAFLDNMRRTGHPIDPPNRFKIYCHVRIWFANHAHADPDNIWKAQNDSLFSNDKWVAGSVDFDYDPENPRVEVSIGSSPILAGN